MSAYELIVFDLDGTLLDTSPGIFGSVRYAESQMGFKAIEESRLSEFVGPPPKEMYKKIYEVDDKTALKAAQKHREYGRTKAIYQASVYEGLVECLNYLKTNGYKLAVATLKLESIAINILDFFGLNQYFDAIIGMDDEENRTKADTIRLAVAETDTLGKVLMVGDSIFDLEGANKAKVDFAAALYGFGFKKSAELEKLSEENVLILNSISDLVGLL